jgi:deazaflavin-dependent oxidoreductase (nitroreductase family)
MNSVFVTDHPVEADRKSREAAAPAVSSQSPAPALVVASRAPDLRIMRFFNPLICALLRSPLHSLLSRQVFLLTYVGRRSGRRYTLPVGYTRDGAALLVISQHAEQKRWWRNLRGGARVVLRLRGHTLAGHTEVIEEPVTVAEEVERLVAMLGPKEASARLYLGLDVTPPRTRDQLAQALAGVVLVRVILDAPPELAGVAGERLSLVS